MLVATDDCEIKDSIQGAFMVSAVSLVREITKVDYIPADSRVHQSLYRLMNREPLLSASSP